MTPSLFTLLKSSQTPSARNLRSILSKTNGFPSSCYTRLIQSSAWLRFPETENSSVDNVSKKDVSKLTHPGYVSKDYYCEEKWNSRLQSSLLQKVDPSKLLLQKNLDC